MQFIALVSWWYGSGWLDQVYLVRKRFVRAADRYSLGLLARTLFSPFRQLDAYGNGGNSLDARLRGWLDRQISRMIGAMIRTFMLIVGLLALVLEAVIAVIRLIAWPIMPMMPIVGLFLTSIGWVPWL